ncbi:ATP-binding protein [Nonomuraea sp. NPDC052129]|uniref:ATP-binding protein n=1 Tax=Nonomuraea sp. NPDC052129 TaxID=3154651 RepID=UPI003437C4CA
MSGLFLGEIVLPGVKSSVPLARRCVADILTAAGHEDVADVRLVTSELITNAVAHTASSRPGGLVAVKVAAVGAEMAYIEVLDEGAATVPRARTAGADDCGGRGLQIVEMFAVAWGVRDGGLGRRVVWAEMSTKADASACAGEGAMRAV